MAVKYLGAPQSGSQAATTASRNTFGQYYRSRSTPIQPRTGPQVANRASLTDLSGRWRNVLSAGERTGWRSVGATISRTDSLGSTYTLTGLQAYLVVNQMLDQVGGGAIPRIDEAPSIPLTPTAPVGLATVTFTAAPAAEVAIGVPFSADEWLAVYVSPPQSVGRLFTARPRFIQSFVGPHIAAAVLDCLTAYSNRYGSSPLPGTAQTVEVRRVSALLGTFSAEVGYFPIP